MDEFEDPDVNYNSPREKRMMFKSISYYSNKVNQLKSQELKRIV
jgi:hypothetical protein